MPVLGFPNGTVVDHIAFAVPETRAGCEHIADLIGVEPYLMAEPEPDAYYWSGGLNLGDGRLLEVVGLDGPVVASTSVVHRRAQQCVGCDSATPIMRESNHHRCGAARSEPCCEVLRYGRSAAPASDRCVGAPGGRAHLGGVAARLRDSGAAR
jgi:hypothetical protein